MYVLTFTCVCFEEALYVFIFLDSVGNSFEIIKMTTAMDVRIGVKILSVPIYKMGSFFILKMMREYIVTKLTMRKKDQMEF